MPQTYQLSTEEKLYEVLIDAFAGATGGAIAQLLFYPLENFQLRLQQSTQGKDKQRQLSVFEAFQQMLNKEGFTSFYKGLTPAMLATMVS